MEDFFLFDGNCPYVENINFQLQLKSNDDSNVIEDIKISRHDSSYEIKSIDQDQIERYKKLINLEHVHSILNSFYYQDFKLPEDIPNDLIEAKNKYYYKLKIKYSNGQIQNISTPYNKYNLPENWNMIKRSIETLEISSSKSITLSEDFSYLDRRESDIIILSCEFDSSYNTYYYKTDDPSIRPYDYVLVEAQDQIKEVQVVNVGYYQKGQTPYPYEKIKPIIKKVDYDEECILFESEDYEE